MAKNNKEIKVVNVENPEEGKFYEFIWAEMNTHRGKCLGLNENLTKAYGVKWYSFAVPANKADAAKMKRDHWIYMCSIFDIIKEVETITSI